MRNNTWRKRLEIGQPESPRESSEFYTFSVSFFHLEVWTSKQAVSCDNVMGINYSHIERRYSSIEQRYLLEACEECDPCNATSKGMQPTRRLKSCLSDSWTVKDGTLFSFISVSRFDGKGFLGIQYSSEKFQWNICARVPERAIGDDSIFEKNAKR